MTHASHSGTDDPQDYLDFPGAEALMAAGRVQPPKTETVAAAQAVLRAAIERDIEAATPAAGTPGARPRRRTGLAGLISRPRFALTALAAAVAAGVVAYSSLTSNDAVRPRPPRAASAKAFLHNMAQVAASAPGTKAPYWKTTVNLTVPADGGEESTHTRYLDRKGKRILLYPPGHSRVAFRPFIVGDQILSWSRLDKLPADPKALLELLPTPNSADGKAKSTFDNAATLLGESPARPELRAALYRVLAGLPGVEVVGPAKDATGRTGTALKWTSKSSTIRLIVDPRTGTLLEETQAISKDGAPQARFTFLSNGPADSIG
ncbi:CU044_5270 family protein [Streptomyces milbemycinicus]|uniref:CU044_5270 family protein n=1 Tax=Streptomyces milbemycinicus TaxID=476552 RepID=UPI0033EE74EE